MRTRAGEVGETRTGEVGEAGSSRTDGMDGSHARREYI